MPRDIRVVTAHGAEKGTTIGHKEEGAKRTNYPLVYAVLTLLLIAGAQIGIRTLRHVHPTALSTHQTPSDSAPAPAVPQPKQYPLLGVDLEAPGMLERVFESVASRVGPSRPEHHREIIFVGVGNTRDRRRYQKDPSLAKMSGDFVVSQLRGLSAIGIRHVLVLSTGVELCKELAESLSDVVCVTSSFMRKTDDEIERLRTFLAEPDDLFVLWAQTWRYVVAASELGYGAMRVDGDVHFAEDPYPILSGPLFKEYSLLTQVDFAGLEYANATFLRSRGSSASADDFLHRTRPRCGWERGDSAVPILPSPTPPSGEGGECGVWRSPLVNCGLVYLRPGGAGGALRVVNDTWAMLLRRLNNPPPNPHPDMLIDQPYFREAVGRWGGGVWNVMLPDGGKAYAPGKCPHGIHCSGVGEARSMAPFVVGTLQGTSGSDRFAGLPDWFVGRACAVDLGGAHPAVQGLEASCARDGSNASGVGVGVPHYGALGRAIVAVHMVYATAPKRKRVFRALGWWRGNDKAKREGECGASAASWPQAGSDMVAIGHTFFNAPGRVAEWRGHPPRVPTLVCSVTDASCPCCTVVAVPNPVLQVPSKRQLELSYCSTWEFYD
eukprot:Hpha_TRINITY_DN15328_c4_g8::TRINITY_DN15328_c4_g8_i1::g.88187::m.88187